MTNLLVCLLLVIGCLCVGFGAGYRFGLRMACQIVLANYRDSGGQNAARELEEIIWSQR